ncbi:MAG: hypothetical protein A2066_20015 [Bacteroidetes bacterium GWB2_41_8]|nr:MAG: hypothetical protein A2066_20015 [Bacteroidetes bacterium GWB2_41_8]
MTDHQKISQTLEKLLNSKTFSKSGINKELLNYLVNCTLKGENPKEYQIANDVFGKKADQQKDINIRVYIFNLRIKLDEYYKTEGKEDTVIIQIPKGKYKVEFRFDRIKSFKSFLSRFGFHLFAAGLIFLVISVIVIQVPHDNFPKIKLWKEFLKADFPIQIVLGDHYFFNDTIATGRIGISRDTRINSDEDLDLYLKAHPELIGKISKNKTTYINKQAPVGLFGLMQMFGGDVAKTEMKFSSQLSWDDLPGKHLIFIGSVKTIGFLDNTIEKLGLKYDLENSSFIYQTADSVLNFNNRSENYLQNEHACLIYFTTGNGRKILFLLSDSDIGNIAAVKYLTDEKSAAILMKKAEPTGSNFKAVFQVRGRELTDFQVELLRVDAIQDPVSEIWP